MDTPCHVLTGFVTGLALSSGEETEDSPPGLLFTTLVSLLPDMDFFLKWFGMSTYLTYHRTLNSIFLLPFLLLLFIFLYRRFVPDVPLRAHLFWGTLLVGLHVFMDLWNTFGSPILFPLTDARFALDLVFIIDPFIYLFLLVPVISWCFSARWSTWLARGAFGFMGFYILFCGVTHLLARSTISRLLREHRVQKSSVLRTGVTPQPLLPFRRSIILQHRNGTEQIFLNTLTGNRYAPDDHYERNKSAMNLLSNGARHDRDAKVFRRFARYPIGVQSRDRIVYADLQFNVKLSKNVRSHPVRVHSKKPKQQRLIPFRLQCINPTDTEPEFTWIREE